MAKKLFTYRGKTLAELQKMSMTELVEVLPSRQRRSLKRGFTDAQKKLVDKIKKFKDGKSKKTVKTHCRGMIILPDMVGLLILVHNGKQFTPVTIQEEMIGHYLGEYVLTRKKIEHSAPGIGATRSSASISVR
jgi:small subunit ribosomal protein S19